MVIDDFLPEAHYEELSKFIGRVSMTYGSRSNTLTDPHGHWSARFVNGDKHNLADYSLALEHKKARPLKHAWEQVRRAHVENCALIRCYLNGYTYGTDGYFHADSRRRDEHTIIIYMNDEWEADWAGETAFLDNNGDIVRAVLPKKNRAVIFPSNQLHAGRGVSRKCPVLRKTLIFKARLKRSDNFEKLSSFLFRNGCANLLHKEGSLHDHLVRTFAILEQRGCPPEVCFGAGLHSIYGTSIYTREAIPGAAGASVVAEFGPRAEKLARVFSMLDRPDALEKPIALSETHALVQLKDNQQLRMTRKAFADLALIECANLIDQNSLKRHENLSLFWSSRGRGAPALGSGGAALTQGACSRDQVEAAV